MNLVNIYPPSDTQCFICFESPLESKDGWAAHRDENGKELHLKHVRCWDRMLKDRISCSVCMKRIDSRSFLLNEIVKDQLTLAYFPYVVTFISLLPCKIGVLLYTHGLNSVLTAAKYSLTHDLPSALKPNATQILCHFPLAVSLICVPALIGLTHVIPTIKFPRKYASSENNIHFQNSNMRTFFNSLIVTLSVSLYVENAPISLQITAAAVSTIAFAYFYSNMGNNIKTVKAVKELATPLFIAFSIASLSTLLIPNSDMRLRSWSSAQLSFHIIIVCGLFLQKINRFPEYIFDRLCEFAIQKQYCFKEV